MKKATRDRVRKAEADFRGALRLASADEPFHDLDLAVNPRYPGTGTSMREAASALRWAGKVRDACRSLLGLRPPRRRGKRL